MTELRTMTLADAMVVTAGMRDWDRRAVRALMGEISDEAFAVSRWQQDGPAWALYQNGTPVAVGGLAFMSAWSAVFWLLCTPQMTGQSWRKLLRQTRTVIVNVTSPAHEHYRHRVEAHTLGGWGGADALVERLGFRLEGCRRKAGSGGEDFHVWAIAGQVKGVLCQQAT